VLRLFPSEVAHISLAQSVNGIYALLLLATLWLFPDGLSKAVSRLVSVRKRTDD
jgi:hypothetical protein